MNGYHYSLQQQPLLKQSSQILTPLTLQQQQPYHMRSTLTERSQQEPKSVYLHQSIQVLQNHITREPSSTHLLEPHMMKYENQGSLHPRNSPNENQRNFSDYQIVSMGGRVQEGHLPTGGGYNITGNKIGEKVKHKTELHKSSSKSTLIPNDPHLKVAPLRVDGQTQNDRESVRVESALEIMSNQMAKLNQRLTQHQDRIDKLQKNRREQCNNSIFSSPQMEQINKILSLVQKSQNRDDYKRALRMIDQLRGNILDLHSQIKSIQPHAESLPINFAETVKELVTATLKEEAQMQKKMQIDLTLLKERAAGLESKWEEWKKQQTVLNQQGITISTQRFQGKMTTLHYQQRITMQNSSPLKASKVDACDKQNCNVLITSKIYYIDNNGYLLDKNRFYLLNSNNQQIRLTEKEINLLKKHEIL